METSHVHEIGLDLKAKKFACLGCEQIFNHDEAAGRLERTHGLDRWRRMNAAMERLRYLKRRRARIENVKMGLVEFETRYGL